MAALTAVGVDIGGTRVKGGVVSEDGELLARAEHPTELDAGTKSIIGVVDELLEMSTSVPARPAAVGIGAAGFVDAAAGSVTFSPNLSYDDPHLRGALSSRTGLEVIVDNDANAAAWGERAFGVARGLDHLALVTIGTGIGAGFVVDGGLLRGSTGAGAEFGHTVIDPAGPHCPCGLRGCVEQFCSGLAIAALARELLAEDPQSSILSFAPSVEAVTAEHVARAARQLDETAREVLRKAGRMLGIGLSNIANVFDPEAIVLSGGVTKAGEPFLGPVRDELVRMTVAQRRRPMRLDVSILGGDAGILGAAALALDLVRGT